MKLLHLIFKLQFNNMTFVLKHRIESIYSKVIEVQTNH